MGRKKKEIQPEMEVFSTRVKPEIINKVKHLAVDEKKTLTALTEEALKLLLKKYKK